VSGFWWQVGGKREVEGEREKDFKNLLLPCLCICRGEKVVQCRSKWHRAVFFKEKEKNLGVTQKWVMTISKPIMSIFNH